MHAVIQLNCLRRSLNRISRESLPLVPDLLHYLPDACTRTLLPRSHGISAVTFPRSSVASSYLALFLERFNYLPRKTLEAFPHPPPPPDQHVYRKSTLESMRILAGPSLERRIIIHWPSARGFKDSKPSHPECSC